MRVIKRPFVVIWGVMRTRRGRVVFATVAGLTMFGSRAKTVISRVPERSRPALQGVTSNLQGVASNVRGMVGQEKPDDQQPAQTVGSVGTEQDRPGTGETASRDTAESAEPTPAAQAETADAAANIAGDQSAGPPTAPAGDEIDTVASGEDQSGTFRPTRAETDEFGVVVTDDAPAGLDAGNWVKGDGTPNCPERFPIKGNANSRIYHLPGESSYERTVPELCFATEEDAAAAGYRPRSK